MAIVTLVRPPAPWHAAQGYSLHLTRSSAEPPPKYSMIIHSFVLWSQRDACQPTAASKLSPSPRHTPPGRAPSLGPPGRGSSSLAWRPRPPSHL